ncbi:MAG: M24 family metallopeptidase [Rhizobiaceae bacterium]|nr:M24 family metallopeptidase [Rhizobiaceae bacterium]
MTRAGKSRRARLATIELPDFGVCSDEPVIDPGDYQKRFDSFLRKLAFENLDAAVIYADREHSANLSWLTGFDPRFEEALLIVVPDRAPTLLTGPENVGVAASMPLNVDVVMYPPMGLMGQDREQTRSLPDLLSEAGISSSMTVGACGWKYYGPAESPQYESWLELPAYIVDTLRNLVGQSGRIVNAGSMMMSPVDGLRSVNSIDELARYEFAACHTSEAVKRVIFSTRPGMSEYEAARNLQSVGMPLTCHPMFSSGRRAWHGLLSPSSRVLKKGDAVTNAYGVRGALNCRAGWLASDASDLLSAQQDYVDVLVKPYFEAIAEWLETIEIGQEGGVLDAIIRKHLGDPFFGVHLNPGHLIHLEEWMHTPIYQRSKVKFRSGMAIQVDVIPATGSSYFTTNVEDGIILLDGEGRSEFAQNYPQAMQRIERRRAFMEDALGIGLKPDCLPLSNIAGWLPPFWLSPDRAMTIR